MVYKGIKVKFLPVIIAIYDHYGIEPFSFDELSRKIGKTIPGSVVTNLEREKCITLVSRRDRKSGIPTLWQLLPDTPQYIDSWREKII